MHTIKHYIPLAIAAVILSLHSCSSDDAPMTPAPSPYITIGMAGNTAVASWQREVGSRDEDPSDLACDVPATIGVYGYNKTTSGQSTAVFENRQMYYVNYLDTRYSGFDGIFESRDNLWPYYNPEPWIGGAAYKFFAYGPYTANVNVEGESYDNLSKAIFSGLPFYSSEELLVANDLVSYTARASGNDVQEFTLTHLLSRLRLCFKLGPKYADLRIIHVTEVEVTNPTDRTFSLTVDYNSSAEGDRYSYTWAVDGTAGTKTVALQQDESIAADGYLELSKATNSTFTPYGSVYGCTFSSASVSSLNIKVTYDVFDLTGQLLRKDNTVNNTINLKRSYQLKPGYYYDINLVVEPTFLYVLSDNDPDPEAHGYLVVEDNN